jgi:hypothetical protein
MTRVARWLAVRLVGIGMVGLGLVVANVGRADDIGDEWRIDKSMPPPPIPGLCVQQVGWCVGSDACEVNTPGYRCGNSVPGFYHRNDQNYYGYCTGTTGSCIKRDEVFCARVAVFADATSGICDHFVCWGYVTASNACDLAENS